MLELDELDSDLVAALPESEDFEELPPDDVVNQFRELVRAERAPRRWSSW